MKIALGMIIYNEEAMLKWLLHRHASFFDGIFVTDTGSTDSSIDILRGAGAYIESIPWTDFSTARNNSIEMAEREGFDYMMIVDADESILEEDFQHMKELLQKDTVFLLPRFEFINDTRHINSIFYPDFHTRIFPLKQGYHYRGKIHECIFRIDEEGTICGTQDATKLPWFHIYHYGKLKSASSIMLKYINCDRVNYNLPRLDATCQIAPSTYSRGPIIPFYGKSPV